ncbi:FMN-linked oxidoreductase [Cryphonectria parasitica EP155]|uniref:L-lactate dehydrogenase (cytochrome) n=1 Tax=Cryphonectria parasitica (strain ATCC 38755 / EP155) TaxID=660469 RepID=A0A9P5CTN6_CRYP1|nr:FMN-linked oxidoreductase [Cryphonectria parasitica EP155]KAF3769325.1 FMN-linked oxidoreductase [Cryphonectria parasitica EP155]
MAKEFTVEEVAKHTSPDSCWVILYGNVYDVTDFLAEHPGGSKIILKLAGKDATEEYDPIHPPGTLEENLKPEARLGRVNPDSLARAQSAAVGPDSSDDASSSASSSPANTTVEKYTAPPLDHLLNLDEIADAAKKLVSAKCRAYYDSASDDLFSKIYNNSVYRSVLLRPRVFVDCVQCDTSTSLLGQFGVRTPIFVCPAAMARLAHSDGEAGIAKGAGYFGACQIISNNASMTPEQVVEGAHEGQVFGWQLYVHNDRAKSEAMLARIVKMRQWYKFIVLTLDAPVPGKREMDEKQGLEAAGPPAQSEVDYPVIGGGDKEDSKVGGGVGQALFAGTAADLTWKTTLPWLKKHAPDMPVVLKGVQTHEDVYLAARYARENPGTVKAVLLSNHGGRALDTAPPALHTLLECRKYCPEVFNDIEIWVDGGIKRGTDVVKALCLGAKAVGIGRAPLWGLGVGGWRGVYRTFEILQAEVETCMRLLGASKVEDLGPRFVNARALERDIYDGEANLDKQGLWEKAALIRSKL